MRSLLVLPLFLALGIVMTCRDERDQTTQGGPIAVEGIYRDSLSVEPTLLELKKGTQLIARLSLPPGYLQDDTKVRMWLDTPDVVIDRIFGPQRMPTVSIEFINRFGKVASIFGEASLELIVDEPLKLELQRPDSEWTGIYETFIGTGLSPRMFAPGEAKRQEGMVRVPVFGSSRITVGRLSSAALQNRPPRPSDVGYVPYLRLQETDTSDDDVIPRCLASVYGAVAPANGDIEIDLNTPITMVFTTAVDETSLLASFKVENVATGAAIAGTSTYNSSTKTLTFTPSGDYPQKTQLQYRFASGLKLSDGTPVSSGTISKFTTLERSNLLAHWRFDGNGNDSSGNNKTATALGDASFTTSEKVQGSHSATFDGIGDAFSIDAFNFGNTYTVTVWVYLANPLGNGLRTILANGDGGKSPAGFKFFINTFEGGGLGNDLAVAMEAGTGPSGVLRKTASNFVTVGSWKHMAFIIDKTAAASQRAQFYFNGTKATSLSDVFENGATEFPNSFPSSGQQAYIGRFRDNIHFYKGNMDDFRIYNKVLTDSEIAQIATQE